MIDISREDFVIVDGTTVPLAVMRALLPVMSDTCHCTIETRAPSVQTVVVKREPSGAITHVYGARETGTPGRPIQTNIYAEVVRGQETRIVERDSVEHDDLLDKGWSEGARTKPAQKRVRPTPIPPAAAGK